MNTSAKSTTSIQFWGPGHLMFFLKNALPMIGAVLLVPHVLIASYLLLSRLIGHQHTTPHAPLYISPRFPQYLHGLPTSRGTPCPKV
jgi:hypothetical protein